MAQLDTVSTQPESGTDRPERAELVVGLATYNDAGTITGVLQALQSGLKQSFPSRRAVIVHVDGGSTDGTAQLARDTVATDVPLVQSSYLLDKLASPVHGIPSHLNALKEIALSAEKLGAVGCVLLDPATRNVSPEWVVSLGRPVLEEDFDLVIPCFRRARYEGGVSNGIVYPMIRALYGKRIRQPLGNEFALSGRFLSLLAAQAPHKNHPGRWSADVWVVTEAIVHGCKVCQVFLGEKPDRSKNPSAEPGEILAQILGGLFATVEATVPLWQKIRGSAEVPSFNMPQSITEEDGTVSVKRMLEGFRLGYQTLHDIWGLILPPALLLELKKIAGRPDSQFRMSDDLWSRTVYDFALGYRLRVIEREHLLRALAPLYLGWLASFVMETENLPPAQVDARLEQLCLSFEAQKGYLISRWRWPDRFNP